MSLWKLRNLPNAGNGFSLSGPGFYQSGTLVYNNAWTHPNRLNLSARAHVNPGDIIDFSVWRLDNHHEDYTGLTWNVNTIPPPSAPSPTTTLPVPLGKSTTLSEAAVGPPWMTLTYQWLRDVWSATCFQGATIRGLG